MDVVTHAALGVTVGRVGPGRGLGRSGAWLSLVASVAPDLDVLYKLGDPWAAAQYHRVWSHSLVCAPLIGAALAGLWWVARRQSFGRLWCVATLALLAHIALDTCTSYGTVLLAPLSYGRFAVDCIAIVDPVYTLTLLVGLGVCGWCIRRGRPVAAWRAAAVGLAVSTLYMGAGGLLHQAAMRAIARDAARHGREVVQAGAYPTIGSILVWRAVYATREAYYVARVAPLSDEPSEFAAFPIAEGRLVDRSRAHARVGLFRWFSRGMVRPEVVWRDGEAAVVWHDMRYGWPAGSSDTLWSAAVRFDADGRIGSVDWVERHPRLKDLVGDGGGW